jgi:predicted nucleic acid-binding protein
LALTDAIPDGSNVAFDTDSIIYFVERHPEFHPVVAPVFRKAAAGSIVPTISVISLVEVLTLPLRQNMAGLVASYRDLMDDARGFETQPVEHAIANRAAEIRARWNLATPDAIIAATAIEAGCTHLVTNDPAFRRVEDLQVLVISDYA